jgi:hypothetical protein
MMAGGFRRFRQQARAKQMKSTFPDFVSSLIPRARQYLVGLNSISYNPPRPPSGLPPAVEHSLVVCLVAQQHVVSWVVQHPDKFQVFMNELFDASLHVEEGRQVRIRVALALPIETPELKFVSPLPFEAKRIVKLAPSVDLWNRHLLVQPDSQHDLHITGLRESREPWSPTYGRAGTSSNPRMLAVQIHGPGLIRLGRPLDCEYNKGEVAAFSQLRAIASTETWLRDVALQVDGWLSSPVYSSGNVPCTSEGMKGAHFFASILSNILGYMIEAKHGGCLAVVPDQGSDWEHYVERGDYRLDSSCLVEAMKGWISREPAFSLLEFEREHGIRMAESVEKWRYSVGVDAVDFPAIERRLEQVERLVASLSYLDGAVVLSKNLRLMGFGVRFTAPADDGPSPVNVGMRHRSARDFCRCVPDSIAIVVSQDGGVTVYGRAGQGPCEEHKVALNHTELDT